MQTYETGQSSQAAILVRNWAKQSICLRVSLIQLLTQKVNQTCNLPIFLSALKITDHHNKRACDCRKALVNAHHDHHYLDVTITLTKR